MFKKKYVAGFLTVILSLSFGKPSFAWSDSTEKSINTGETLEARIWLEANGNSTQFDATSSGWIWDKASGYKWDHSMKIEVNSLIGGLSFPAAGGSISIASSGKKDVTYTTSSTTHYAGIQLSNFRTPIDYANVVGTSTVSVSSGSQTYIHSEDVYKWW